MVVILALQEDRGERRDRNYRVEEGADLWLAGRPLLGDFVDVSDGTRGQARACPFLELCASFAGHATALR
jgi:hypothetical protein